MRRILFATQKSTRCDINTNVSTIRRAVVGAYISHKFFAVILYGMIRFMDTIISLRYWQLHLPPKDHNTTYSNYMNESFLRIKALLPVYFDRTRTYANHCYGINTTLVLNPDKTTAASKNAHSHSIDGNDHDSTVLDFLFRQDKLGGPPMAIGIVLDSISTSNWHVERGFSVESDSESKKSDDVRMVWPAIYLRSTMHLPTPAPPKTDAGGSGIFASSHASLLSNWATAGSSHGLSIPGGSPFSMSSRKQPMIGISPTSSTTPPSHRKAKTLSLSAVPQLPFSDVAAESTTAASHSKLHALEYGPEFGTVTSWPHTNWGSLARILGVRNIPDKLTPVVRIDVDETEDSHKNSKETFNEKDVVGETETESGTLYDVRLGPFLHLITMVNDVDDDGRLSQRRKNQMNPDDIKTFMSGVLAPKLRISTIFSMDFLAPFMITLQPSPNKETKNRTTMASSKVQTELYLPTCSVGLSLLSSTSFWSNEHQVQEFLRIIKSSFGLRPSSPVRSSSLKMNQNSASLVWGTPRTPTEVMKNLQERQDQQHYSNRSETASAAMFFLGPELASSFE